MPKATTKSPGILCPMCGEGGVTQSLPQEIDRQLFYEDIIVPAEPEPQKLKVAIMRITYQRDYLCTTCGHQWSKTFKTESQKHV
jgi:hypothetical protein